MKEQEAKHCKFTFFNAKTEVLSQFKETRCFFYLKPVLNQQQKMQL